jgi:hypothetical protein
MDTSVAVVEISGVVRAGNALALVSDKSGSIYILPVPSGWPVTGPTPFRGMISFESAKPLVEQGLGALDLESLDLLADGTFVVLSERLGALIANGELLAVYPTQLGPIGGRGLEGLAVRNDGTVAVVWEGGWLNTRALPTAIRGVGALGGGPLNPVLCIHELPAEPAVVCIGAGAMVPLEVPDVPVAGHAFRAVDLVWAESGDELIVLLGSGNQADNEFKYRWLQRFSTFGTAIGEPINLCDPGLFPDSLQIRAQNNFEGLGWFDAETLVLVNDTNGPTSAVLIEVLPWPVTDATVTCDSITPG